MIDVDLSRRCYLIKCTCVATNPDSIRKGKEKGCVCLGLSKTKGPDFRIPIRSIVLHRGL